MEEKKVKCTAVELCKRRYLYRRILVDVLADIEYLPDDELVDADVIGRLEDVEKWILRLTRKVKGI